MGGISELANVILLSAIKKGAEAIQIARKHDALVVEFRFAGAPDREPYTTEEMRPPLELQGPLLRRLGVMASLPYYPKGMSAEGRIQIEIGSSRLVTFAIHLEGHGPDQWCHLKIPG